MLRGTNIKRSRLCAFCKHWYDPANLAIRPQNTVAGAWLYEDSVWNICQLYNAKKKSRYGLCEIYVKNLIFFFYP